MNILFQGDSVTDGGRNRKDPFDLGVRYVKFAVQYLKEMNPDRELSFRNLGIAGNETADLVKRMDEDIVKIQPDIISLMIGINDVEHYMNGEKWLDNAVFESQMRNILQTIKEKTNARLMLMEPVYMPPKANDAFRRDLSVKVEIIRKLASEFADVYVPTEGLLHSAFLGCDLKEYIPDGLHPTEKGAQCLGKICAEYLNRLINM